MKADCFVLFTENYFSITYGHLFPFFLNKTKVCTQFYGLKLVIETKKLIMKKGNMILNYIFIETNNYLFIITWIAQNSYTGITFYFVVGFYFENWGMSF